MIVHNLRFPYAVWQDIASGLLLIACCMLLGCGGGYHNPMYSAPPTLPPTSSPSPNPMHHRK